MNRKVLAMASVAACVLLLGLVASAQAPANVAGTWTVTQMGARGPQMATLVLMQNGTMLTGTFTRMGGGGNRGGGGGAPQGVAAQGGGGGGRGPQPLAVTGTIMGNNIDFTFTQPGRNGGPDTPLEYKGTVSGSSMMGTVSMNGMDVAWSAMKQ